MLQVFISGAEHCLYWNGRIPGSADGWRHYALLQTVTSWGKVVKRVSISHKGNTTTGAYVPEIQKNKNTNKQFYSIHTRNGNLKDYYTCYRIRKKKYVLYTTVVTPSTFVNSSKYQQ